MTERFAIFYAPAQSDPLWDRAAQWLGRDAASDSVLTGDIPGIDADRLRDLTVSARRYGFHATLKPPMALAAGRSEAELRVALAAFCDSRAPVPIGRLKLALIDGFLALVPEQQTADLSAFAADCVIAFDGFRAPMSPEARARRLNAQLSARQIELLDTYGYPYVLENFRFHMTLTDRLPTDDRAAVMGAAEDWFGPLLERSFVLDRVALFHESTPNAAFRRGEDVALGMLVAADA